MLITLHRLYDPNASIHGIVCDAQGVQDITTWWKATQAVCRARDVAVSKRVVINNNHPDSSTCRVLLHMQYTAWLLCIVPTVTMHVHVLLDVQGLSSAAAWTIHRHEEQVVLGKFLMQLPLVGGLWHAVFHMFMRLLWLPVLAAAVRS